MAKAKPKKLKAKVKAQKKAATKSVKSNPKAKKVNSVLAKMGKELRVDSKSAMFCREPAALKSKLVQLEEESGDDGLKSYYKNMMFRCVKCDGSFTHKTSLPYVEYKIKCPHCSEAHILKFKPTSRLFTVHSDTVDVLDRKK